VENWKRAIQVAVDRGVDTMNSEFGRGPHPERGSCTNCCQGGSTTESSEVAWWRSMDELVPIFEREGINLHIEPHPEDFVETLHPAVDMIRTVNSERVKFLYCAPHTFYFGDDVAQINLRRGAGARARARRQHLRPQGLIGLRYIVNPPGSTARVHQHLDIGQGEVPWDAFFGTLTEVGFDGIMTACVFAWEERAEESSRFMRAEMQRYVDKHWK
jgi:myo-inositol catabolism protein IolH